MRETIIHENGLPIDAGLWVLDDELGDLIEGERSHTSGILHHDRLHPRRKDALPVIREPLDGCDALSPRPKGPGGAGVRPDLIDRSDEDSLGHQGRCDQLPLLRRRNVHRTEYHGSDVVRPDPRRSIVRGMSSRVWRQLAEMVGLDREATNWQKVNQKRNMQRYGTMDRNDRGPSPLDAIRKAANAGKATSMTPRPGGLQIPSGTDRPGQGNPLMAPPTAKVGGRAPMQAQQPSPMSTTGGPPNDHEMDDEDWLQMLYADDDDEET